MAKARSGTSGGNRARLGFEEAVRQAYKKEHGDTTLTAIAERMGIGKSALSQLFSGPRNFKRETLENFVRPIPSDGLRKSILEAYQRENFVQTDPEAPMSVQERVARLAHENRPDMALELANEALSSESDDATRWILFVLALKNSSRLDLPAESMRLAVQLKEWGEASRRPELVAAAFAVSARALRRTAMFHHQEAIDHQHRAEGSLPDRAGLPPDRMVVWRFADDLVRSERIAEALHSHETLRRGESFLREELANIARRRKERAATGPGLARAYQLEASIRLGLGELEPAGEAIDASIASGGGDVVARLEVGPLKGRLLEMEGKTGEAVALLRRMAQICERDRFVFLGRLAQKELALIEKRRMERP